MLCDRHARNVVTRTNQCSTKVLIELSGNWESFARVGWQIDRVPSRFLTVYTEALWRVACNHMVKKSVSAVRGPPLDRPHGQYQVINLSPSADHTVRLGHHGTKTFFGNFGSKLGQRPRRCSNTDPKVVAIDWCYKWIIFCCWRVSCPALVLLNLTWYISDYNFSPP